MISYDDPVTWRIIRHETRDGLTVGATDAGIAHRTVVSRYHIKNCLIVWRPSQSCHAARRFALELFQQPAEKRRCEHLVPTTDWWRSCAADGLEIRCDLRIWLARDGRL